MNKENEDFVERLEQTGMIIHKMFWLAGAMESQELNETLMELDDKEYEKILPNYSAASLAVYLREKTPWMIFADNDAWGFFCELRFPHHKNFSFNDKGEAIGWTVTLGIQAIGYAYGNTLEELVQRIEVLGKENHQRCLDKFKRKQSSKPVKKQS